jgi:hypothetical protein
MSKNASRASRQVVRDVNTICMNHWLRFHFLNVKLFPLSSFLARFNPVDVSSAF